ncbi:MAG: hypothetical protein UHS54_10525 [Lachnospiraceae bacterium]|nr:hypothetical protein [Lachnospiraceae bacterium]
MMKKRIAAALIMGAVLVTAAGCSNKETNVTEESDESTDMEESEVSEEVAAEQAMGEAQTQADEIDAMHQDELATESVEQTAFAQSRLYLAESDNWIRTSSENREDGSFGESYQANERLDYSWDYTQAEKTDAQAGLDMYMAAKGWTLSENTYSEDITAALGCETYYYTAYEDDNGYSMLHRGIYINTEAGYYTADFSMMEGDTGEYYEMAGLYLAQISFVD